MSQIEESIYFEGSYCNFTLLALNLKYIICSFEERLAAQRKEREMATVELGFKKPLTKEEKIEKKKQRLAAIGSLNVYILS